VKSPKPSKRLLLETLEHRLNPASANIHFLTEGLVHSTEYYRNEAQMAYQQILGRDADAPGLKGWIAAMKDQGLTNQEMVAHFVASDEFLRNNQYDANLMVGFLYQNLLGRKADPAGLQAWVQGLDNLSTFYFTGKTKNFAGFRPDADYGTVRDLDFVGLAPQNRTPAQLGALKNALKTLANQFQFAPETLKGTIQSYYTGILGRGASASEVQGWYNFYKQGVRDEDLLKQFISSREYQSKFVNTQQLIMGVYEDVLFRPADLAGFKAWSTILDPKSKGDASWVKNLPDVVNPPSGKHISDDELKKVLAASYANLVKDNGLERVPYLAQNDPSFMLRSMKNRLEAELPEQVKTEIDWSDDEEVWDLIGHGKWDTATGQWTFDPKVESDIEDLHYHRPTNAVIVVKPGTEGVTINPNPVVNPWSGTAEKYHDWLESFQESCWLDLSDFNTPEEGGGILFDPNRVILDWEFDFDSDQLKPIYEFDPNHDYWTGPIPPVFSTWAYGDFDGDGIDDWVSSGQPGLAAQVTITSGDGSYRTLLAFDAYPDFKGFISVAVADIQGDGKPELITATGPGAFQKITAWTLSPISDGTDPALEETLQSALWFREGEGDEGNDEDGSNPDDGESLGEDGDNDFEVTFENGENESGPGIGEPTRFEAKLEREFLAKDAESSGFILASGDLNGDGIDEILAGSWHDVRPAMVLIFDPSLPSDQPPAAWFPFGEQGEQALQTISTDDFRGDGQIDILVTATDSWKPFWFAGNTLQPIAPEEPDPVDPEPPIERHQAAFGDFDGDGFIDEAHAKLVDGIAVVTAFSGANGGKLFVFAPYPETSGEISIAAGDLDGNGKSELITSTGEGTSLSVLSWTVEALAAPMMSIPPREDVPGEGNPFPEWGHETPLGDPTHEAVLAGVVFEDPDFTGGAILASADLDGDGLAEVLLGLGGQPAKVVIVSPAVSPGTIANEFLPYGSDSSASLEWIVFHDIDGNGQIDIGVNAENDLGVLWFDGKTTLPVRFDDVNPPVEHPVDPSFQQFANLDIDGDGLPDLVSTVFHNSGYQVSFQSALTYQIIFGFDPYPGYEGPISIAAADIDGNGTKELITGTGPGRDGRIDAWSIEPLFTIQGGPDGELPPEGPLFQATLVKTLAEFSGMTGGLLLAAGDLDGDGVDEVLAGTTLDSLVKVLVINPATPEDAPKDFLPFPEDASLGIFFLGVADINHDGRVEIVVTPNDQTFVNRFFDGVTFDRVEPNFPEQPGPGPGDGPYSNTWVDANNDGSTDWVIANNPAFPNEVVILSGWDQTTVLFRFDPFPEHEGLVTLANADLNGDGILELVTGTGPGGPALVMGWFLGTDPDGQVLITSKSEIANLPEVTGGVIVASGDLNEDGISEILLGSWIENPGMVWIYDPSQPTGTPPRTFSPFPDNPEADLTWLFTSDVNTDGQNDIGILPNSGLETVWFDGKTLEPVRFDWVDPIEPEPEPETPVAHPFFFASGDLNQDGFIDWVLSRRPFSPNQIDLILPSDQSTEHLSFNPYPGFEGAIPVAVGDINGDGTPEILTSTGPGVGLAVKAWNLKGELVSDILDQPEQTDGAFIATSDLNGDGKDEVILGTWTGTPASLTILDLNSKEPPRQVAPFGEEKESIAYLYTTDLNGDGLKDIGVFTQEGEQVWLDAKTLKPIDLDD